MATFSKTNFIIPVGVESTSLKIRDAKGQLRHTILHNNSTTFFNSGKNVVIRTEGDSTDVILDFSCVPEAIQALSMLNKEYAKLKMNLATKEKVELIDLIRDHSGGDGSGGSGGTLKQWIFSLEPDANSPITNQQTQFLMPVDTKTISNVYVNGVVINDYIYNATTRILTIDPVYIGYEIDIEDEVMVKFF